MSSLNKVMIIGNLGDDPKLETLSNGARKATLKVATTERGYTTRSGARVEDRTEWHTVVFWEKIAEFCANHLHKGSSVFVEGALRTSSWTTDSGDKRFMTFIDGKSVQGLDRRPVGNQDDDLPE